MVDTMSSGNITREYYEEFISNFDPRVESDLYIPETWCVIPTKYGDYLLFSKRIVDPNINIHFYCKYDEENKSIIMLVKYIYLGAFSETSDVLFEILDYKNTTYKNKTTKDTTVCFSADEDIISMIGHFNHYLLSIKEKQITFDQYKMYLEHLYKNTHETNLLEDYDSDCVSFQVRVIYEFQTIVVRIYFQENNKEYDCKRWCDFLLYKNRIVGDEFNNLDPHVNGAILERLDAFVWDFQLFSLVAFK
jgi:hypothetical protein